MQDDIQTYVGVVYERKTRRKVQKVVALDLDETIGSFSHLHILWNGILRAQKNNSLSTNCDGGREPDVYSPAGRPRKIV